MAFMAFFLSSCQISIGTSNIAYSTPSIGSASSGDEFVRCPNRPSKQVRAGFESSLCYN